MVQVTPTLVEAPPATPPIAPTETQGNEQETVLQTVRAQIAEIRRQVDKNENLETARQKLVQLQGQVESGLKAVTESQAAQEVRDRYQEVQTQVTSLLGKVEQALKGAGNSFVHAMEKIGMAGAVGKGAEGIGKAFTFVADGVKYIYEKLLKPIFGGMTSQTRSGLASLLAFLGFGKAAEWVKGMGGITPEMEQKFKDQVFNISQSLVDGQTLERKSPEEERKALFKITTLYQQLPESLRKGTYATLDLYVMAVAKEQITSPPLKTTVTIQEIAEAAGTFNVDQRRQMEVAATVPPPAPNPTPPATPAVTSAPASAPPPVSPVTPVAPATPPPVPPPSPTTPPSAVG